MLADGGRGADSLALTVLGRRLPRDVRLILCPGRGCHDGILSAPRPRAAMTQGGAAPSHRPLLGTDGLGRQGSPRRWGAIAVELATAGAFFHGAGSSNRKTGPSEVDRPETFEDTGELMNRAGGDGGFSGSITSTSKQ